MAYDPSEWTDLFVASAGASAALAGLVFVAVPINIDRILRFPGLPERALETVLLGLAVVITALSTKSLPEGSESTSVLLGRLILRTSATLPFVVGGASVIAETGGGLYWTTAASSSRSRAGWPTPGCCWWRS
ncbi:MAG TPA: hypothetical protein VIZ61_04550 [Solirubrobacterales bacterium]